MSKQQRTNDKTNFTKFNFFLTNNRSAPSAHPCFSFIFNLSRALYRRPEYCARYTGNVLVNFHLLYRWITRHAIHDSWLQSLSRFNNVQSRVLRIRLLCVALLAITASIVRSIFSRTRQGTALHEGNPVLFFRFFA